ncbi:hypothetical protein GLOIN_2v1847874 [Rhizophagus clarus]|uniref:G-protein coupled receptors family 1 profile domain-containing protein n=1 Tax=Rhizophagus clarus TaxID=94130 RepID=A0A8H3QZP8_9GLOM|nr:hypothetical protein GLOIN_2v1847874 [Rhizophagus clarus]
MIYSKKSSNIILIFSIFFFNVNALNVLAQNTLNNTQNYRLNNPDNIYQFHIVMYVSVTMSILGWCGCIYVFYRTYEQWKLNDKKLKMIHKLPFYTACSDFLIDTNYFINVIHTAIYAEVWGQPVCNIISGFHWLFLMINLSLYGVIAVTTYLRICHEIYFYRGKYDYKLWLIVITTAITFELINMNNYGPRKYWCIGKPGQKVSFILLFILITLILIIICYCYFMILYTIKSQNSIRDIITNRTSDSKTEEIENMNKLKRAEFERRAAWKIISYILLFILQWLPVQINIITRWISIRATWSYVLGVLVTFGGFGNAIIYICNEGWFPREYEIEADISLKTQDTSNFGIIIDDNNNDTVLRQNV